MAFIRATQAATANKPRCKNKGTPGKNPRLIRMKASRTVNVSVKAT
jgi:hypothetical protein